MSLNKPKCLSGAQKRKKEREREESIKKLKKIDVFFKIDEPLQLAPLHDLPSSSNNRPSPTSCDESVPGENVNYSNTTQELELEDHVPVDLVHGIGIPLESDFKTYNVDVVHLIDTDLGRYTGELDDALKIKIVNLEPHQPKGPFLKDSLTKRSFSSKYYHIKTKTGQVIHRFWLCYSKLLNAVYCHVCWLFADRNDKNFNDAWCNGTIKDWQGLTKKVGRHEISIIHLTSCVTYENWKKNKSIVSHFLKEENKIIAILSRILNVILTLAHCNIPFRGHDERSASHNRGNFLSIIDLLAMYDPLLKAHIDNEKNRIKYLSPKIQNEMISLLSDSVLRSIVYKIKQVPFFSILLDTTQDVSRVDQLSVVIRYVTIDPGKSIITRESFIGFFEMGDQSGKTFEKEIMTILENNQLDLNKCRGQGYDGAANMSGKYHGLQARIKERVPTAVYVHCAAHNLNLVLNDSVSNILDIGKFYTTIEQIYVFFSESLPRWQKLNSALDNATTKRTLKKLCPTRWSSRFDSIFALKNGFVHVMICLENIILFSNKAHEKREAISIKNELNSFEFVLMLVFQSKILLAINIVSKYLQEKSMDLLTATSLLKQTQNNMIELRQKFSSDILKEAEEVANTWKINRVFKMKRQRHVKKFFDELAVDECIQNPEEKFRVSVFNSCLDIIIQQLTVRYESMNDISAKFSLFQPPELSSLADKIIVEKANRLYENYSNDLSPTFPQQVLSFRSIMNEQISKLSTIKELAELLIVENSAIASSVPDLCTVLQLYLTLPVTTAMPERSFSKLKLIKTYLRSTMSQMRLSSLALLAIESEESKNINVDKVVNEFLSVKQRRFGKL